jgi:hypothetical protein
MKSQPTEKPTLQQIRQQAKTLDGQPITRQLIAEKAGLTYGDVYVLDIGGHLAQSKVRKVLWAFNELSGSDLTVHDIRRGGYN